jgi:hypothetical protein
MSSGTRWSCAHNQKARLMHDPPVGNDCHTPRRVALIGGAEGRRSLQTVLAIYRAAGLIGEEKQQ